LSGQICPKKQPEENIIRSTMPDNHWLGHTTQKEGGYNIMWDNMPTLESKKSPVAAFFIGCLFGAIGIGIYFKSFLDFLVPFVILIIAIIIGAGIGGVPGWLFAGFWGMMRSLDSNHRLGY
jgi:hypothetical protein